MAMMTANTDKNKIDEQQMGKKAGATLADLDDRDQLQIEDDNDSQFEMGEDPRNPRPTQPKAKASADLLKEETAETQSHRGSV